MKWLGKQYTKPSVKGFVISMYLGLLAAGIYGTAKMKVEADVADFIPAKSYLRDWYNTLTDNFGATGTDVNLYWVNDAQVVFRSCSKYSFSALICRPGVLGASFNRTESLTVHVSGAEWTCRLLKPSSADRDGQQPGSVP